MSTQLTIGRIMRHPFVAVFCYVGVVSALMVTTLVALADIHDRQSALSRMRAMLDQMEGRTTLPGGGAKAPAGPVPKGSPFLEGPTMTVAGAAILQRVAGTVQKFGGNILSSQVGLEGPQSKNGMVSVSVSAELGEPQLQQVLYDIETGMPFLFVEQLVVQSPRTGTDDSARLRVLLGVSGQWQGAK
jgi:general secretion pathway protein M